MEELPALPGDEIDVRELQVWAAERPPEAQLRAALTEALTQEGGLEPAEAIGGQDCKVAARLASLLQTAAEELLHRWGEAEWPVASSGPSEVAGLCEELAHARAGRLRAHQRLQEFKECKQAAQSALGKAMEIEESEEEDLLSQGPSEILEDTGEEGKKRGWSAKRFLGKGFKKMRGRRSQTGSLTPPAAVSPTGSFASSMQTARTPSPTRPPTPKQLMVQASSDELVRAAEGIQSAAEDLDKQTLACRDLAEAISQRLRKMGARGLQEAPR
ncbi:unnamed protein product [Effrenium voratum]|nr:unnamed protein product [Effrenium voratum]